MKKIFGAVLAASVMLVMASCSAEDTVQEESSSGDMAAVSMETTVSSEEASEETTADTAADASVTEAAVISEKKIADGVILPPDEDFLRSIYSDDGTLLFTLDSSGKYSACDDESLYNDFEEQRMQEYVKELLSEEFYEENKEYFEDEVSSYEEYKALMEEYYGDELQKYLDHEPEETEPLVYFAVESYSYIDEDKTAAYSAEQILIRSAERLVERINEEPEIAEKVMDCFENGGIFFAVAQVEYDGDDVISIGSYFTDSLFDSFYGESSFFLMEDISADGREGIVLNGVFVPADTEKLLLSYSDQLTVETVADEMIPEDCFMVCNSYKSSERNDDLIYDLKAISEKLPHLKELYLCRARVTNTEYISEMKGLESLCYDAAVQVDEYYESAVDTPFKDLPKLKALWLYGDYTDYSFLNDMPGLENAFVSIDTWRKAETLPYDSVFDCPVVTGFEIEINNDLTGLEKLTNLQHLHLTYGWVSSGESTTPLDISVVKKLKNLTCLEISASGFDIGELSGLIGDPSKLENLELVRVKTTKDWSFLSELTSLKRLYLFEIPYIATKDVEQMPWLESLRYHDTNINSSIYYKIPDLKNE